MCKAFSHRTSTGFLQILVGVVCVVAAIVVAARPAPVQAKAASSGQRIRSASQTAVAQVAAGYGEPFVDRDEWRDTPVRHRYIHGGFRDTAVRFMVAFPEQNRWQGRFMQYLQGGFGGNEHSGYPGGVQAAFQQGAYYVESNQGHIGADLTPVQGDVYGPEANAANGEAARYARELAKDMYGGYPTHGFAWGYSSGSNRASALIEIYPELYDGAVLVVMGQHPLLHFAYGVQAQTEPILRSKVQAIADAVDAGGGGNPFAVLDTAKQKEALRELYRAGYPRGMEWALEPPVALPSQVALFQTFDPSYFEDFWDRPGYAGHEDEAEEHLVDRVRGTVQEIVRLQDIRRDPEMARAITMIAAGGVVMKPDTVVGIRGDDGITEPSKLLGMQLTFVTGSARGSRMGVTGRIGDMIQVTGNLEGIEPGDEYFLSNRAAVAMSFYQRYLVDERYPVMRRFICDGNPLYPQRDRDVFRRRIRPGTGVFRGKVIVLMGAQDVWCWPTFIDYYYLARVRENLGDRFDDHCRIYFTDKANHLPTSLDAPNSVRLLDYRGFVRQALEYLVGWVSDGAPPPESTNYTINEDNALVLPASARDRKGYQPVAVASANGRIGRAEVHAGDIVYLDGVAEMPSGLNGGFIRYEWDFEGTAQWSFSRDVDGRPPKIKTPATYTYDEPGTYFATLRVSARDTTGEPSLPLLNLDRVRIVVSSS